MLHELFIKDWLWKLSSLLLAVAIWFNVHHILGDSPTPKSLGDTRTQIYRDLPVAIVSASGDMRNYRLLQPTVSVSVSGPTEIIGTLQANQLHATVDLTETNNVNTKKQRVDVSAPPGVMVISINPEAIGVLPPP